MSTQEEQPWHAAYPAPRNTADTLPRHELLQWLRDGKQSGKDFVLVDLRRTDFEGGTIRGSLNLPAQSLYPTLPTLYSLVRNANVPCVIWYCGMSLIADSGNSPVEKKTLLIYIGSSRGRGTRAAGWFADRIEEQGESGLKSLVLGGGIKGWAGAGSEYTEWMEGYEEAVWKV